MILNGKEWRLATEAEIAALRELDGAPHVTFGCTTCGKAGWSAKNIALGSRGGYNGARNIFFIGEGGECPCPGSGLRCIVEV